MSIAIATYNMESYLRRCVDSVLSPHVLDDIEIMIVNDGSRDGSLEIAREYEKRYPASVRVLDKENGGYGSAINLAIDQAFGKYFKTLDADDWFDTESFIEYVGKLKYHEADLIITHFSQEYVKNERSVPVYYFVEYEKPYDFRRFLIQEKISRPVLSMHSLTYKTEILRKDGFRLSHCYYSDMEYVLCPIAHVRTIVFLDLVVYKYYLGREGQSVSAAGFVKHFDDCKYVCKKLVDFYTERHSTDESAIGLNIGYGVAMVMNDFITVMFGTLHEADPVKARREIKEFRKYLKSRGGDLYLIAMQRYKLYNKIIRKKKRVKPNPLSS